MKATDWKVTLVCEPTACSLWRCWCFQHVEEDSVTSPRERYRTHLRDQSFLLLLVNVLSELLFTAVVVWPLSHVPINCSIPGFPVLHCFLEFAQTYVHWVIDTIQPSHPLSPSSPLAFSLSQHQGLFQWVGSVHQVNYGKFSMLINMVKIVNTISYLPNILFSLTEHWLKNKFFFSPLLSCQRQLNS